MIEHVKRRCSKTESDSLGDLEELGDSQVRVEEIRTAELVPALVDIESDRRIGEEVREVGWIEARISGLAARCSTRVQLR